MPRWMLHCPRCRNEFPHSKVTFGPLLADPFGQLGNKPNFPADGLSLKCPNCKETTVYQRHLLFYRHEAG